MAEREMAKVGFRDGNGETETGWAADLGDGRYRLENVLWFSYGVSLGDVFAAAPDAHGDLEFTAVLEKSGNRSLRVMFAGVSQAGIAPFESQHVLSILTDLGCAWEHANGELIAVNVPAEVKLDAVTEALDGTDVRWEYADPTPEEMGVGGLQ